jgi:toxin ParE1/3/4
MGRHRLAPAAEASLDHLWYYIASESGSMQIADRVLDSLARRFVLLAGHPYVGRRRDDIRHGLRSFPVGEYVIFYRIAARKSVVILDVMRGSRNVKALLGD